MFCVLSLLGTCKFDNLGLSGRSFINCFLKFIHVVKSIHFSMCIQEQQQELRSSGLAGAIHRKVCISQFFIGPFFFSSPVLIFRVQCTHLEQFVLVPCQGCSYIF